MKKAFTSKLFIGLSTVLMFAVGLSSCGKQPIEEEKDNPVPAVSITLDHQDFDLYIGESDTIKAESSVSGLLISWASSNKEVATVDNDGNVFAFGEGYSEIIASVGTITSASVFVHVTEYIEPVDESPKFEVLPGFEELDVFNTIDPEDVDLTKGLIAKDYLGNELEIEIINDGGFNPASLGVYTVQYKATDSDNGLSTTFARTVRSSYFGLNKDDIDSLELSESNYWSFAPDSEEKISGLEWKQHVVSGHNEDWNKFEGPYDEETKTFMNCLILHGSDTNGHGCDGIFEEEDEYPNTILYNKLEITKERHIFHMQCSVNPYPDYNNMISKFRFSVMNPENYEVYSENYRTQLVPFNAAHDGIDFDKVRNGIFENIDLSEYIGQTIILLIEQDSSTDVYQDQFYLDIGYMEFQIPTLINETRDTFVIYNMGLVECFLEDSVCAFTDAEWRGLTVDDSTSWGIYDVNDPNFGLRNDIDSLHKWSWYNCTQKCDMSSKVGNYATQFISWATCPEEINDLKPEQCFVNKIIASKSRFLLRCGTDTDGNMINIRFSVITDNGIIHHMDPVVSTPGEYTQLQDCWGKVQKSQWVYGTALEYDLSAYLNQEITILLETDQAAEGNPTIWLDAMALI